MSSFCFHNDRVVEKKHLYISVDDLGFSRGYALFEHCRTYFGKPFHLKEHFLRLLEGARDLLLHVPYSIEELSDILSMLFEKNGFEESGFKIYLTLGLTKEGLTPSGKETFIIYPYPLPKYEGFYPKKGLTLKTTFLQRSLPAYKTTFYLPGMLAKRQVPECDDILFLNGQQHLLESSTAAFLAFRGDTLLVPEGDFLQSITQAVLVQLARSLFKIEERPISYDEIPSLSEAFLSSSSKEIFPIDTIDHMRIGDVSSYRNTLKLKEAFYHYVHSQDWPLLDVFKESAQVLTS
jgi:branched-subunit amino acid aminotransferase/4-amino-4-deoxychorismate lyase